MNPATQPKSICRTLPHNRRLAFTLIELLIVVTILLTITALLVPRLRIVTSERNIREAARSVGSLFAQASLRASVDGIAGVEIIPNANLQDPDIVVDDDDDGNPEVVSATYGATQLTLLRRVPNYSGNQATDVAVPAGETTVEIPIPIEQRAIPNVSPGLPVIQQGDSISFGNRPFRYQITNVNPIGNNLEIEVSRGESADYLPALDDLITEDADNDGMPDGVPFTVFRLPRPLRSSTISLPAGYAIDLRYSGIQGGVFPRTGDPGINSEPIRILFDDQGRMDRLGRRGVSLDIAQGTLFLFVIEIEDLSTLQFSIARPNNLWVTVSNLSGATNIGFNNPVDTTGRIPNNSSLNQLHFESIDAANPNFEFNDIINESRDASLIGSASQ